MVHIIEGIIEGEWRGREVDHAPKGFLFLRWNVFISTRYTPTTPLFKVNRKEFIVNLHGRIAENN